MPLDTRHHHFKPKPRFPEEWLLTDERRAQLLQYRRASAIKDQQKALEGKLVDGLMQIEEGLNKATAAKEAMPELLPIGELKPRGKRVAVRR